MTDAILRIRRRGTYPEDARRAYRRPHQFVTREAFAGPGVVAVAGCMDRATGYAEVGAWIEPVPEIGRGKFGRKVKRIAKKIAKSKALKKVAKKAAKTALDYSQAGLPVPPDMLNVAVKAATKAAEERRGAQRAARQLQRERDRDEGGEGDEEELDAEDGLDAEEWATPADDGGDDDRDVHDDVQEFL